LPIVVHAFNIITEICRHRYNLVKTTANLVRYLKKRRVKYSFLTESVVTMCLATYLHNPKFILDRIKIDLKRLKYSSQRYTYFNFYMKEIIEFFTVASPRLVTMQMRVIGKVSRSVRTVKLYNPDPFLSTLVPYRRFNADIYGLSTDIKTNRGVISVTLL